MTPSDASKKKLLGHAEETTFNAFFGDKSQKERNYSGSSEDNFVSSVYYQKILQNNFGVLKSFKVSLKSGNNWQFHLGRIDELSNLDLVKVNTKSTPSKVTHSVNFTNQLKTLKSKYFWNKYLGKGDLLCYTNKKKAYTFFRMSDVIKFIIKKTKWRILNTGRLKGILELNGKDYSVLTFEYRKDKKQFVLGAFGGNNGIRFFNILKNNIKFFEIFFESETKNAFSFRISKKRISKKSKGKIGEVFFDENFIYICVDTDTWKRVLLNNF